jgi:hypothetical protein
MAIIFSMPLPKKKRPYAICPYYLTFNRSNWSGERLHMVKFLVFLILIFTVWNVYKRLSRPQSGNDSGNRPEKPNNPFKDQDVSDGEFREVK